MSADTETSVYTYYTWPSKSNDTTSSATGPVAHTAEGRRRVLLIIIGDRISTLMLLESDISIKHT